MICRALALCMFLSVSIWVTAQTQSTLSTETGNNTSACSTATNPSYCSMALPNFMTKFSGAQTVYIAPTPGHVSPQTIQQSYLYPGATTRIIAAYQPWFNPNNCWTGTPTAGHPCVGYSENNTAVIAQQHSTMLARGFTDVSPDWYGNSSSQSFLNQTVIDEAADLSGRCNGSSCPMHLMIMIDKGLITSGMSNAAGCPTGTSNQTTCITTVLDAAYDYIDANWGRKPYYSVDSASGQPITLTFLDESQWSGTTWSTVWANVKAHMNSYATPYKIVKEFGNFTEANIDGAYAWVRTQAFNTTAQYCWQGYITSTQQCDDYMNRYYSQARTSGKLEMGGLYIGFDGSENTYNNGVTARQCGQVLVFHGNAITSAGYSSSSQLPWLLASTWNDYGEGTNIENGVDNCWRVDTPTINGSTVTWTQSKTDSTYAAPTTIDHFRIWYGSGAGDLTLSQDNILPSQYCNTGVTSCSFDLNTAAYPPPGNTYIYVEQIPKALLFIQMNGGGNGNGNPVLYAGSNVQTINNIDDSPFTWSQISGSATSTFTQGVSSPSKDGSSSKIAITSAPNFSWAKWQTQLGAFDSYSHFTLDLWVRVSEPTRPQSLEFSVGQVVGGNKYFFSFQCDFKGTGFWEVWSPPTQTWSSTTAPCSTFASNTFTELTFDVQRTPGNQLQYNWLKVNGQQYNINQTLNPTSNNTDAVEVDVIPHVDGSGDLYSIWVDEINLTMQ
jgi:hypothetical protein